MKTKWDKKMSVALTATMMLSVAPVNVLAKPDAKIVQSEPEEVYVDIIGEGQRSTLFNENWKFHRGDVENAQDVNFNDTTWENINLPHDYSIDQEFTTSGEAESGFLPGGVGWYRKSFVVPEKYKDKQLMVEFDGAYMNAEVYLNGKKLGDHPYGYTAFAFDLTDGLICDGKTENVLVVKTNNQIPSSRWYSGSGIYRDVTLTVTDDVHVGYNGTQIIAQDLEANKNGTVEVDITTTVENDSDTTKTVTVKNTLLDENGKVANNTTTSQVEIAADSTQDIEQSVNVEKPELWSVDDANMYKMKTEIVENDEVLDTYETDYGFRYYNFDKDTGFSLNGEKMKLKGVSMHHDQGSLGAVANRDAIERQVKILKEMGCNAIRVTHNPAASALLDICNEYGMLVINEAFDGWTEYKNGNVNDYTSHFEETITADNQIINGEPGMQWGEFDTKAMVDGAKNDPSVIMWSIGNEITEGVYTDTSHYVEVAGNIIDWIQEVDTTRPVTNGDNQKNTNPNAMISKINQKIYEAGGVVGLNYANNNQTVAMHNTYPDWPIYGSETASAVHSRGIYNVTGRDNTNLQMSEYDNDEAKVGWGHSASDAWSFVIKNDFNAGEFVWTGFDYLGEPTPWNGTGSGSVSGQGAKPKSSFFGIVDTAGFPKDTYYLYKSLWDEDSTTLHLMSTWNNNEIVKDANGKIKVDVFTNAAKVELYLNGKKIGEDSATKHTTPLGYTYQTFSNGEFYPSFKVDWAAGKLSAKAYDEAGNLISDTEGRDSVSTNSDATQLDAYADKTEIMADGSSLSYITVDVKDDNNNIVAGANNKINFSIEGEGKIVGVDNGNPSDTDSYKGNSRKAFSGKALVIVQSTKNEGSFTVTASSDGLQSSSVTVNTKRPEVEGDTYLQSYKISKNMYVGLGQEPELPQTVVGTYNNGEVKELNVEWDSYDKSKLNTVGEFTITGKLQDSDAIVSVTIHVIGNVVAMENYSTVTNVGVAPELPQTLRGFYEDGKYSEAFPVTWDIPEGAFANEGIVTINGTASVLDGTKNVTATIRVAPKLEESTNIASKDYQDAPVFTNGRIQNGVASDPSTVAISDSLLKLNDGTTNDGTNTDARWTNWALRNENPPVDTYVQLEWKNEYTMQNVKLWHFTDSAYSVLPGDDNVRFEYFDSETNEWKEIESSHITQIPYTSGDTPYGFITPITTSKLRIWLKAPQAGKCIGLTEVEVYNYVKQTEANTTTNLDELKLNGTNIEDFEGFDGYNEETKTYTVNLKTADYPTVEASAKNNESITVLPVYNDEVKIIVKSEDGKSVATYTIKYNKETTEVDKTKLQEYVNSQEIASAINSIDKYTVESYQVFKEAYDKANEVLANADSTQEEVNQAYQSLKTAYENLEERVIEGDANKFELSIAIDLAKTITDEDLKNVIPVVVTEFKDALAQAQIVLANPDATQEEVDTAFNRLANAMWKLEFYKGNKAQLQAFVEQLAGLNEDDYSQKTWLVFEEALNNANVVLANENAMQEEVDETYTKLVKAFLELRLIPNKDLLADLINQAESLNANDYTAASYAKLNTALVNAKNVFANVDATIEDVTAAEKAIETALTELVKNPSLSNNDSNAVNSGDTTSVKTGDATSFVSITGLGASLSALAYLFVSRKKKSKK